MILRNICLLTGLSLALSGCQVPYQQKEGELYYGFTLIDPASEDVRDDAWVVIVGENIAEIGSGNAPISAYQQTRDMTGTFAMPGLIDAHAHITAGPYKMAFKDGSPVLTMESRDDITAFNARMALAFGVTTVRNPGGATEANQDYDENIAAGVWIGPEALHAGAVVQPPPMGGSAFTYPTTEDAWIEEARTQADKGMVYFKLYVGLNEDELAKGIEAAHSAGFKATGHLHTVSWTRAAQLGIDGLEHALPTSPDLLEPRARELYLSEFGPNSKYTYQWFEHVDFEGHLFQEMVDALVAGQVELNFNFLVNYIMYNGNNLNLFDPSWDKYSHPDMLAATRMMQAQSLTGWTEADFVRARAVFPKVLEFGKRLYDAGLPIMIGTDASGGLPYLAMEMGFHVEAGIPVWEALRMTTSSSAEILGIGDRTGQLKPGMEADIVFLHANPLDDVANVAGVELTISNGQMFLFEELVVGH